jgi:hypothetical protein
MRARSSHIRLPSCWLSAIQNWPPVGPEKALKEFDKALASLPPQLEQHGSQPFFAGLAHARSLALGALGQQH